jgi:hypothetical protein
VRIVDVRRATPDDYAGILELAEANYEGNLSPGERRQGFLSARFTLRQVADVASDLGIVVGIDEGRVAAFVFASRCEFADQPDIVKAMVAEFDRVRFQGRPLSEYGVFVYGPACIGRDHRGRGLLRKLYEGLRREVAGKYDLGTAFIAEGNPHSLKAHVEGLGMSEVGRFTHAGHGYHLLAFPVEAGKPAGP